MAKAFPCPQSLDPSAIEKWSRTNTSFVKKLTTPLLLLGYVAFAVLGQSFLGYYLPAGGESFPLATSLLEQLFTTMFLAPILLVAWESGEEARAQVALRDLICISSAIVSGTVIHVVGSRSSSLQVDEQMVGAFLPLATALTATWIAGGFTIPSEELLALILVGMGGSALVHSQAMALHVPASPGILGPVVGIGSMLCGAILIAVSERTVHKLGAVELTFYASAAASVSLLPLFLLFEYDALKAAVAQGELCGDFFLLLLALCVLAPCYKVTCNSLLRHTSGVFLAIANQTHIVVDMLAWAVLGNSHRVRHWGVSPEGNREVAGLGIRRWLCWEVQWERAARVLPWQSCLRPRPFPAPPLVSPSIAALAERDARLPGAEPGVEPGLGRCRGRAPQPHRPRSAFRLCDSDITSPTGVVYLTGQVPTMTALVAASGIAFFFGAALYLLGQRWSALASAVPPPVLACALLEQHGSSDMEDGLGGSLDDVPVLLRPQRGTDSPQLLSEAPEALSQLHHTGTAAARP
mmetsp:Transcript_13884/g.32751  ORF Transcript_13884/g.32751 Transcript_13884/m.32751 type:complete len:522 (-) Transcript_13884:171-1736(-)